jgi:ferric-dicitrate binding protein FerR (iron transport regulator)
MGNENAENLIKKYLEGTANLEEEAMLESWYNAEIQVQQVMPGTPDYGRVGAEIWEKVKPAVPLWPRITAAAAVLIILSVGTLFILRKSTTPRIVQRQPSVEYKTLTTTLGENYSLLLPDGTAVWLNAGSSITYPVAFNGSERRVKVTGEVYFEIVHNPKQPFRITVKNELVEDIGTHLDINAYDDESTINTTLLEGSIKVSQGSVSAILKPGQQARIRPNNSSIELKEVDADKAIVWKNGYFYFDRADLQTVMRQLARWYNVQVVYKKGMSKKTFKGKVERNINVYEALGILSYFGAHFQIEGKTITVSS